jgi:hypothetical protein
VGTGDTMKFLSTIGMLTIVSIWAALAVNFPYIVMGTAGIAFLISLIYIWDIK